MPSTIFLNKLLTQLTQSHTFLFIIPQKSNFRMHIGYRINSYSSRKNTCITHIPH